MNLPAVRQAMADLVTEGCRIDCSAYMLANPTPPAAHLFPSPVEYDAAFNRGMDVWTFTLQVYVAETVIERAAQERLDEFMSTSAATSVKRALELPDGPQRLGGLIDDLLVLRCDGYRRWLIEGRGPLFGSEWTIEVRAEGA